MIESDALDSQSFLLIFSISRSTAAVISSSVASVRLALTVFVTCDLISLSSEVSIKAESALISFA